MALNAIYIRLLKITNNQSETINPELSRFFETIRLFLRRNSNNKQTKDDLLHRSYLIKKRQGGEGKKSPILRRP